MAERSLISVVIPCYNYGVYLSDAIQSVLHQKGDNFDTEIIVVDDGSRDNTRKIAESFGASIRYVYQENKGLSEARNTGIKNATGDFLMFLDADDELDDNVFSSQLENFARDQSLDISVCHCYIKTDSRQTSYLWPVVGELLDLHLLYCNIAPVHSFMLRAETIRDAGLFNSELKACEDYDYWLRCARLGKRFAVNPNGLAIYKQHSGSMSSRSANQVLYDVTVRNTIPEILRNATGFPAVDKYYGWLAYAAGTITSSAGVAEHFPHLAFKLINGSAEELLRAGARASKIPSDDPALRRAEEYYALDYLLMAESYGEELTPALKKASDFIRARYPRIAALTHEKKKVKKDLIFNKLCCDYDSIKQRLTKYLN